MKIGEFIEKVHTTKDTVRHYEELGLLQPAFSENKHRTYTEKEVIDFQAIKEMQELDMTLKEIQVMFEVKRTNGCGSEDLLGEVIETMREKQKQVIAAEKALAYKKEQITEMLGVLNELSGRESLDS